MTDLTKDLIEQLPVAALNIILSDISESSEAPAKAAGKLDGFEAFKALNKRLPELQEYLSKLYYVKARIKASYE